MSPNDKETSVRDRRFDITVFFKFFFFCAFFLLAVYHFPFSIFDTDDSANSIFSSLSTAQFLSYKLLPIL